MNERTFGNFVENASAKIFSFYLSDCKTGGTSSEVLVSSGGNTGLARVHSIAYSTSSCQFRPVVETVHLDYRSSK